METDDITTGALVLAVCDLLVNEHAKFNALVSLLQRKGLLSSAEVSEAAQSIASLPLESIEADWQILQQKMQERVKIRAQELMLQAAPKGPTQ